MYFSLEMKHSESLNASIRHGKLKHVPVQSLLEIYGLIGSLEAKGS